MTHCGLEKTLRKPPKPVQEKRRKPWEPLSHCTPRRRNYDIQTRLLVHGSHLPTERWPCLVSYRDRWSTSLLRWHLSYKFYKPDIWILKLTKFMPRLVHIYVERSYAESFATFLLRASYCTISFASKYPLIATVCFFKNKEKAFLSIMVQSEILSSWKLNIYWSSRSTVTNF